MQSSDSPRLVQSSPELMLLTVKQLAKENAELCEEVKQLRAAVNVYRELAMWKSLTRSRDQGSSLGKVRAARDEPTDPCQSTTAQALP
jgi:hypothetical protein